MLRWDDNLNYWPTAAAMPKDRLGIISKQGDRYLRGLFVDQVLDVDGREHGLVGTIGGAVGTFDTDTLAVFDDQVFDHLVG